MASGRGPWLLAPQWARPGALGYPIDLGVLQTFRGTDGVPCRWGAGVVQTSGGLRALVGAKALQAEPLRGQPWWHCSLPGRGVGGRWWPAGPSVQRAPARPPNVPWGPTGGGSWLRLSLKPTLPARILFPEARLPGGGGAGAAGLAPSCSSPPPVSAGLSQELWEAVRESLFLINLFVLFTYFWLRWVFVAAHGLLVAVASLVAEHGL